MANGNLIFYINFIFIKILSIIFYHLALTEILWEIIIIIHVYR